MRRPFLTPAAAVSTGKEPELDVPHLPDLEPAPHVLHGVLGVTTVAWSLVEPSASPLLFGVWMAFQLVCGVGVMLHQRRLLLETERVCSRARALLGEGHPATQTLCRYHRILVRLLQGRGRTMGLRAAARRWALAQRLAHRCHHLLNEWPRLSLPAPSNGPVRASLNVLLPLPDALAGPLPPLLQRARARRRNRR